MPTGFATPCWPRSCTTTCCHPSGGGCMPPTRPPSTHGRSPRAPRLRATWRRSRITRRPPTSPRGRCVPGFGAARAAAAAYAFTESLRAYERAIELWDAVPADDRPEAVDAAELYFEASMAAHVSGRVDRAPEFARVAVSLIDRTREPDRWVLANERLARTSWGSGATTEGLGDPRGHGRGARRRRNRHRRAPGSSPRSRVPGCSAATRARRSRRQRLPSASLGSPGPHRPRRTRSRHSGRAPSSSGGRPRASPCSTRRSRGRKRSTMPTTTWAASTRT